MNFSTFISHGYLFAFVFILLNLNKAYGLAVGLNQQFKRQSANNLPMLTLDVEPHAGVLPSHAQTSTTAVPDYYFPIGAGLFNFTCTIKHPSYFDKLVITRERLLSNGERLPAEDLIASSGYVLNPLINDKRISLEFFSPDQLKYLDQNVLHLRATLLIKNLNLNDNAIYTCNYGKVNRKVNTIVYKQPQLKDLSFPHERLEKFELGETVSVVCEIKDVYPKPQISFIAPNRPALGASIEEVDVTPVNGDSKDIALKKIHATLKFKPDYTDNGQQLNCSVTSQTATNTTLAKPLRIQVHGKKIIEANCSPVYTSKVGVLDHKIECVYFSNPRKDAQFEFETDEAAEQGIDAESALKEDEESSDENTRKVIVKSGYYNEPNLSVNIERYGEDHQDLYKAVLTIKEVTAKSLRTYKFKLEDLEQDIVYRTEQEIKKELTSKLEEKDNSAVSLIKIHSNFFNALMVILVLFLIF